MRAATQHRKFFQILKRLPYVPSQDAPGGLLSELSSQKLPEELFESS